MTEAGILSHRLFAQQLAGHKCKTVAEVMSHMGAIQSQDYAMAKWAIGIRMAQPDEQKTEKALDKGTILRTHVLRPTWHIVSAADIHWMLALTAPRIKAAARSRHKELGFSEALLKKSNRLIAAELSKGEHLTREELLTKLEKAHIPTDENRSSHLLLHAELEGLICSGMSKGNKRSYALLESRVPGKQALKKEEALAKLAAIYFKSRGPATVADFTWWSGLSLTEARLAVKLINEALEEESYLGQVYYFATTSSINHPVAKDTVHLLPAFDEYLISYKDRSAALHPSLNKKVLSSNGIFWPVILADGKVVGSWKRKISGAKVTLESESYQPPNKRIKSALKHAAGAYGQFLGLKTESCF